MMGWLANLIGFGRAALVNDGGELQLIQVAEGKRGIDEQADVTDDVPMIGRFGFTSAPPLGSEVVLLRREGDRSRSMVIGTSHRPSRPTRLEPGDSGIYDVRGRKVMLTADGITIDAAGGIVTVTNASKVRCTCDIETTGDVRCRADGEVVSLGGLHDAYNAHKHIGVQKGGDTSGLTDHAA